MKVFISLPMVGREDHEIRADIQVATDAIKKIFANEQDLKIYSGSLDYAPTDAGRLWYLGKSISVIGLMDAVYFCPGWRNARGCQVVHLVCELYDIQRIETD